MDSLPIRKVINQIANGAIRIPSFQRGFVWEPEDVAFFLDSLYIYYLLHTKKNPFPLFYFEGLQLLALLD